METSHDSCILSTTCVTVPSSFPIHIVSCNSFSSSIYLSSFVDIEAATAVFLIDFAPVVCSTWKMIVRWSVCIFLAHLPLGIPRQCVANNRKICYRPHIPSQKNIDATCICQNDIQGWKCFKECGASWICLLNNSIFSPSTKIAEVFKSTRLQLRYGTLESCVFTHDC